MRPSRPTAFFEQILRTMQPLIDLSISASTTTPNFNELLNIFILRSKIKSLLIFIFIKNIKIFNI